MFPYVLTNTGNVPKEAYALSNTAPEAASGVLPGTNVTHDSANPDTNGDGVVSAAELAAAASNTITSISGVDPDQAVKFWQAYTVSGTATATEQYGADPTGTCQTNSSFPYLAYVVGPPSTDPLPASDLMRSTVSQSAQRDSRLRHKQVGIYIEDLLLLMNFFCRITYGKNI